ncbi:MAG: DUF2203 family protein [Myxococcota bacterium]
MRTSFTVAQAHALVPWLTEIFSGVKADVEELLSLRMASRGRSRGSVPRIHRENAEPALAAQADSDRRRAQLERRIRDRMEEVAAMGLEVRKVDGMVDIPSVRQGELGYLRWRLDDEGGLRWRCEPAANELGCSQPAGPVSA